MEMAPFTLIPLLGKPLAYAVYLLIGVGFGAALEVAGFANSRKLAAQFYLRDMTVLKVMFTAIVTAMVLVFLASAAGVLDFNRVYVPPTYLWPGIVGGLIMGVGFILGGFCPGTSLVAVASLKIDGWLFLLGTLAGVFLFGETVHLFQDFWWSSSMGRFILPEWLGWSTGATVLAVVVMAVGAFTAAEWAEGVFGGRAPRLPFPVQGLGRLPRLAGAASLVGLAVVLMGMGQPTPAQRWARMAPEKATLLEERAMLMHPGEFVAVATNHQLGLNLMDLREEGDFNRFHLVDALLTPPERLASGEATSHLLSLPPNTVHVLVSNDESLALDGWRWLVAEGVPNVYVLEGGMNGWLDRFAPEGGCQGCRPHPATAAIHPENPTVPPGSAASPVGDERLRWRFDAALGDRWPIADPDLFADKLFMYQPVLEMEVRAPITGGCG